MVKTPTGELYRLEYLTKNGWVLGHHGVHLLHPEKYVERLTANGKFGRVFLLDENLQTSTLIAEPESIPEDLSVLVKPSDGTLAHKIKDPKKFCQWCESEHPLPHDGMCLL